MTVQTDSENFELGLIAVHIRLALLRCTSVREYRKTLFFELGLIAVDIGLTLLLCTITEILIFKKIVEMKKRQDKKFLPSPAFAFEMSLT